MEWLQNRSRKLDLYIFSAAHTTDDCAAIFLLQRTAHSSNGCAAIFLMQSTAHGANDCAAIFLLQLTAYMTHAMTTAHNSFSWPIKKPINNYSLAKHNNCCVTNSSPYQPPKSHLILFTYFANRSVLTGGADLQRIVVFILYSTQFVVDI